MCFFQSRRAEAASFAVGSGTDGDGQFDQLIVPENGDLGPRARLYGADDFQKLTRAAEAASVDAGDDISLRQARDDAGGIRVQICDEGTDGGTAQSCINGDRFRAKLQAQITHSRSGIADAFLRLRQDGVNDGLGFLGRHRQAHALPGAHVFIATINGDIDADHLAPDVHERSTGVAWIDDGVGLQIFHLAVAEVAVAGADDALCYGAAEAERIAHGKDDLTDFGRIAVSENQGREVSLAAFDFQQGDVSLPAGAEDARVELFVIIGDDLHLADIGDDVVVRDDVTFFGNDGSRAQAGNHLGTTTDEAEERMPGGLAAAHGFGIDTDDAGQHRSAEFGEFIIHGAEHRHLIQIQLWRSGGCEFLPTRRLPLHQIEQPVAGSRRAPEAEC